MFYHFCLRINLVSYSGMLPWYLRIFCREVSGDFRSELHRVWILAIGDEIAGESDFSGSLATVSCMFFPLVGFSSQPREAKEVFGCMWSEVELFNQDFRSVGIVLTPPAV